MLAISLIDGISCYRVLGVTPPAPSLEPARSAQKTYDESGSDDYRDGNESASQPLTRIAKIKARKYRKTGYCEGNLDKDRRHLRLFHNLISAGFKVQEYRFGDMRALIGCNPFIVQIRTAIAFGIFDKGSVN